MKRLASEPSASDSFLTRYPVRMIVIRVVAVSCLALFAFAVADDSKSNFVTLTGAPGLTESSGLSFSMSDPACVWTHNDSGDRARLFCFDTRSGRLTGTCELTSAKSVDWEAMTGVPASTDAPAKLIVADCGDNNAVREHITLYRFAEPDPHAQTRLDLADYESLQVRFPNGAVDCEAVWYDPDENCTVLLAKGRLPIAAVFTVSDSSWTSADAAKRHALRKNNSPRKSGLGPHRVTASQIATLALPMATGADRDARSGDVWIASYFQAFCFERGRHSSLQEQLGGVPRAVEMPRLRQVEAIAVDSGSRVWVTTEGSPALLHPLSTETPTQ
ncbi:hypothetical protein FHS27_004030 [Rhodopirellula rubra]|uniref:Integral membrane protein n=1 Tax=Aporhodopirellula rubra TaxID=980271 RepID=A0A7W5E106_9BACT|nr:hypothetical protein [Aporhodopirellula rubra]MBB3208203.1 hypothetical protein [Aporhodopirellula rubra]